MSDDVLLYTVDAGVASITLNRPDKRNALNAALVAALKEALDASAADPEVRVVTITGAGKDFCSGADLAELERIADMSEAENLQDARSLGALFVKMRRHPRPVVALVKGRALAGGCGLATACDLVLATDEAQFGYPEVHLGFVPALVMTILRRKVGEGRAFELVVRGDRVGADEARAIGLVTKTWAAADFDVASVAYVAELATRPPTAVETTKHLLYELDGESFDDGIDRAAVVNARARMTDECRAGVRRFLSRS